MRGKGRRIGDQNTVNYELDLKRPPPLTAEQTAELTALAVIRDDRIDTSDIPPASDEFWRNAVRNPFIDR